MTTTKTIIITNNNSYSNNNSTETTHTILQIDVQKDIDGQSNGVAKKLMISMLMIKRIWYPVNKI